MTDNSDKFRSIVLAALMVFSVFAGTVALSGTAAAATVDGTISAENQTADATTTHNVSVNMSGGDAVGASLTSLTVDYNAGSGNADASNVGTGDVANISLYNQTSDSYTDVQSDLSDVSASNNGETLTFDMGGSHDLTENTTIIANFSNVDNPPVNGTYTVGLGVNGADNGEAELVIGDGVSEIGDGEVDPDQTDNNSIVFAGETVVFDADSDEENGGEGNYVLRSGQPDGDNSPVSTLSANESTGVVSVDTGDLETGSYYITNDGSSQADLIFEVIEMDFGAEFTDDSVGNLGAESETTVEFTSSNRGGESFAVYVTSDEFDDEELTEIFTDATNADVDADGDDDGDGVEITGVNAGEEFDVTFDGYDAGNYSFDFEVADTSATADDSIEVTETGEGSATFTNTSVTEQQGDIVKQTVELEGASNTASVVIGDLGDTGYQGNFTVVDDDDDGEVTFYFNSYTAGNHSDENDVVTLGEDTEFADNGEFQEPQDLSDLLDTGDYDMYAMAGDHSGDYSNVLNNYDSVGTLYLQERSTDSMTLWTANDETTLESVEDINSAVEDDTLTQSQEIAIEDLLVHEVDATGLSGAFGVEESGVVTESFLEGLEGGAYNLTMEQENPAPNREAKTLNTSSLDDSSVTVIANAESDTYYIALDTQDIEFQRNSETFSGEDLADEEYTTTFSVEDPALLGEDRDYEDLEESDYETVNSTVTFVDREVTFDEDPITVGAASEQTISGETTVAPGSVLDFRVSATEDTQPRFVKNGEATVQADGTWSVTFDFSDQSAGDTFNVNARGAVPSTTVEGEVVESTTTETEAPGTDTEAPTTETEAPDTETEAPSTETEAPGTDTEQPDTETTTTTPGFGVAVALVALLAAALLAGRRE